MDQGFPTNLHTVRHRPHEHVERGTDTADIEEYRAERKTVLRLLNAALATEIVSVLRYKRHYYMATGLRAQPVAAEFLRHANKHQAHADQIAARIVQLGGVPDFAPTKAVRGGSYSEHAGGASLVELIDQNLIAERIAIATYAEMFRCIGDSDLTTRSLLRGILATEEEHATDLVLLLAGLDRVRKVG